MRRFFIFAGVHDTDEGYFVGVDYGGSFRKDHSNFARNPSTLHRMLASTGEGWCWECAKILREQDNEGKSG